MVNPRDDIRVEFDNPDFQLPGWPGYRTRPGRSGYDPLDYQYEASYINGRIIVLFVRQDWHTRNPLFLVLLNLFGLYLVVSLLSFPLVFISFWIRAFKEIGLYGTAGLISVILVIYLIIGLGFREIDAILEDEHD